MRARLTVVPGTVAALLVMGAGLFLADVLSSALLAVQRLSAGASLVSSVAVAMVLGLLLRNTVGLPQVLLPGLKFCVTTVLRLGIVLFGIRLSAFDVARLGLAGLPVVIAAVTTGLVFVMWLNRRLGLPPRLGTLVAAGTSICGVTAIVSTASAIEADEREVAYAVANVVVFGLFAMLTYPYLAHAVLGHAETAGLFLGTAIHDTSQVVGASLMYREMYGDEAVLRVATVTKLTRNLCLAAAIPILTWAHVRAASTRRHATPARRWTGLLPAFVVGFGAMAVARTLGDATLQSVGSAYGIWDAGAWNRFTVLVGDYWASRLLLGTAMAAVGLNTSFAVLKGVGVRPFAVGFLGALVVGTVGMAVALVFGRLVGA